MLLSELVCNSKLKYSCTNEIDYTKIEIKDITRDTRQVIDGSMFIAVIGVKVDGHDLINEAIEVSWKWVHTEENVGEVLYNFLDNEENGFTLFQEMEEDEKKISAWDCIIDAVAYVSRAAYENEGIKYLPEPIEIVDDNIFTHMVQSLTLCDSMECEYIEKVYKKCLEEVK